MLAPVVLLLVGLQLKHFLADYVLQTGTMLTGKGDLRSPGGYYHAGVHALGSVLAMAVAGVGPALIAALAAAEFVVHYALDYAKASYGRGVSAKAEPSRYWALHGLDQFLHQLTYVAMIWIVLAQAAG